MAITRLPPEIPDDFPPAKLYLDDIAEIVAIFREDDTDAKVEFIVGNQKCDDLTDLRKIGGHQTRLEIKCEGQKNWERLTLSPHVSNNSISVSGSAKRKLWVINRVQEVFRRRRISGFRRFRWLWLFGFLALASEIGLPILLRHTALKDNSALLVITIWCVMSGAATGYFGVGMSPKHSIILEDYAEKQGFFRRYKDQLALAAIVGLIGTVIGAVITQAVHKIFPQ